MGKGRAPCCDKSQVKRGPWSPAEDMRLIAFIQRHGHENWRALPKQAGLLRCGKSCRLRWINYLRPDLKRGNFTNEEEDTIMRLHQSLGNKWSKIASHLAGRTDNEIKNHWNTHLKKRLVLKGANLNPDRIKESSTITSSLSSPSSSSSSSVATLAPFSKRSKKLEPEHEQNQGAVTKRPRALADVQDRKEHEELTSSSTCSIKSNVTNASQDHVSMPEIEMEAFLDFGGPLEEVNKPDLFDEIANGIQFDCGFEFWDMVDSSSSFCSNELQLNDLEATRSPLLGDAYHCGDHEDDTKNWLRHLEIELGLAKNETPTKPCCK